VCPAPQDHRPGREGAPDRADRDLADEAARLIRNVLADLHRQRSRYGADPRLATALTRVNGRLYALDAATVQPEHRPPRINIGWTHPA
jgi:hypothetical protein